MQQVNKSHYSFGKYTKIDRWSSYYFQIKAVLDTAPESILEIGVGEGILRDYLKNHTKIKYTSLDVAADLKPDFVGEVTKIPFPDSSFDSACAFEVLEHLPFDKFELAIDEMLRVCKKGIIISLPHFGPPIKFLLKIPFLPEIKFSFKVPFPQKHIFDGEHYWEIGKKGYSFSRVAGLLRRKGKLVKHSIPFENQYHHFFVLQK